jgi:DnaJ-class molecular chaperone
MSLKLRREAVAAEVCKCVHCSFCRGSGRDPYDEVGMGSDSPCEECGGSGIVEVCGRCEYLEELDHEQD